MSVDRVLDDMRDFIARQGGELVDIDVPDDHHVDIDELRAEVRRRSAPAPKVAKRPTAKPLEWLHPDVAGVKYSEIRIVITANGRRLMVHVSSHRRRRMLDRGLSRPRWYGTDIISGREVRIRKVLAGWVR